MSRLECSGHQGLAQEDVRGVLQTVVTADYIVTDPSFMPLPPAVAQEVAQLPEIGASMPVRGTQLQIDGSTKDVGAVDPTALESLLNLQMESGSVAGLEQDGILVYKDPAKDLDLQIGDTLDATFTNGTRKTLTVAGIYDDASIAGNWLISLDTLDAAVNSPPGDFFVLARLADNVSPNEGRVALDTLTTKFPQLKIQDQAQYLDEAEGQVDQLLVMITVLLAFVFVIAMLGIAITLALSVYERTREIGLMRAVGMTRRQARRMIRGESLIVTLFGGLVGVVLGSAIGIALSKAVPKTVINTISFPFGQMGTYVVATAVVGLLAAIYPARKAARMNVLAAISTT
ncbi:MAG: FtsX-like permease family protein [Ilumatobacteraceae bacterium]